MTIHIYFKYFFARVHVLKMLTFFGVKCRTFFYEMRNKKLVMEI
jgi:hypothetical protein